MSTSYAETAAEIAAVSDDVDGLRALIEESDRLLNVLEMLNSDGCKVLTDSASKWTADLGDRVLGYPLPVKHEALHLTQAALDYMLDRVQTALFRRHCRALGLQYLGALDESDEESQS